VYALSDPEKRTPANTLPTFVLNGVLLLTGVVAVFRLRTRGGRRLAIGVAVFCAIGVLSTLPMLLSGVAFGPWILVVLLDVVYAAWAVCTLWALCMNRRNRDA
jgi:hypothetical protein